MQSEVAEQKLFIEEQIGSTIKEESVQVLANNDDDDD